MLWVTWEQLLRISKKYEKIIISGCQRSGTTYAAEALANELNYEHFDERRFQNTNLDLFNHIFYETGKKVIQAPAILQELKKYEKKCLIIIMHRNKKDVVNSMLKHQWFQKNGSKEWQKFSKKECPGPEALYDIKIEFSKNLRKFDLKYEELKKTKNFVEKRNNWSIKQTRPQK